jgi:hypothetical protein
VKYLWSLALIGLLMAVAGTALSQPPDDDDFRGPPPPPRRDGPGGREGRLPPPPPGPWEPGRVMPPFVRHELQLSDEQTKQLDELEKDVKDRIFKILTSDQRAQLKDMRPPRPPREDRDGPPPPRRPRRGGPPDDGPYDRRDRDE